MSCLLLSVGYLLAVLFSAGALSSVAVMSPYAVTVYTRPAEKDTGSPLAMAFVLEPFSRVARLYEPSGIVMKSPALLYATAPPMAVSGPPPVLVAYKVMGFELELAFTNRT